MFEIIAMFIIIGIMSIIIAIPIGIISGIFEAKKKRQKEAQERQRQAEEDELRRLQLEKLRREVGK